MTERFPCPCCAYLSLSEKPPGTYEICPVCFWEDDPAQFADFAYRGGANNESLQEARENFKAYRAISKKYISSVRDPSSEEIPPTG